MYYYYKTGIETNDNGWKHPANVSLYIPFSCYFKESEQYFVVRTEIKLPLEEYDGNDIEQLFPLVPNYPDGQDPWIPKEV